jgi:myo-inositol 2-dehydrogenase/D-chiro-inositol 1-dehydrogenase
MRIALLGFGAWGSIHAEVLDSLENHELSSIVCHSRETAERAQATYPAAEVTTDYRAPIARDDIDAVDVVLPSHYHVPAAIAALEAGKHVLLEKPMAPNLADGRRLLEATDGSDRAVSLIHELRCSEQWAGVKHLIAAGEIGRPHHALLNLFRFPYRSGRDEWRYSEDKVGSWVLEEPIHFVDLLLWYFEELGSPAGVTAFGNVESTGLTREFTAVFDFHGGAYGIVSQTLSGFEHHQVAEITGNEGAIRSLWSGAMDRTDRPEFSVTYKRKGAETLSRMQFEQPSGELFEIRRYISDALDGLEKGDSLYPPKKELELIRICLSAEEALRSGQRVAL